MSKWEIQPDYTWPGERWIQQKRQLIHKVWNTLQICSEVPQYENFCFVLPIQLVGYDISLMIRSRMLSTPGDSGSTNGEIYIIPLLNKLWFRKFNFRKKKLSGLSPKELLLWFVFCPAKNKNRFWHILYPPLTSQLEL